MSADSLAGELATLREDRRRRLAVTAGAVVLGLVLAVVHWAGLLVAGALVALPQRSFGRGVAAGVGMGALIVVGFLGQLALAGTFDPVLAMGQPSLLALGIGLLLPAFGSLVRGVV
jgi:lipopolysaccharide export LptBFGC system permease protein LptF